MNDQCLNRKNWAKHYPKYNRSDYDQAYFPSYRFFTRRPSIQVTAAMKKVKPCVKHTRRSRPTTPRATWRAPIEDSDFPNRLLDLPTHPPSRHIEVDPARQIEEVGSSIPISAKKILSTTKPVLKPALPSSSGESKTKKAEGKTSVAFDVPANPPSATDSSRVPPAPLAPVALTTDGTTIIRSKPNATYRDIDNPLFILPTHESNYLTQIHREASDKPKTFYISVGTSGAHGSLVGYNSLDFIDSQFTARAVIDSAIWDLKDLLQRHHYSKLVYNFDEAKQTFYTTDTAKEVTDYIYQSIDRAVMEINLPKRRETNLQIVESHVINDMLSIVLPVQYFSDSSESLFTVDPNYVVLEWQNPNGKTMYVTCDQHLQKQLKYTPPDQLVLPQEVNSRVNADDLFAKYTISNPLYSPPDWSKKLVGTAEWNARAPHVITFCHAHSDLNEVERVVSEREPVNIGMDQPFDPKMRSGYFELYQKNKKLPPNFALYMLARVQVQEGVFRNAHVINSIGFAFDHPTQPDQQYFSSDFKQKENEFKTVLYDMFRLIFACAQKKQLSKICFCYIGGNAFATYFPNGKVTGNGSYDYLPYFIEAFTDALKNAVKTHNLTHISMMGQGVGEQPIQELMNKVSREMVTAISKVNLEKQPAIQYSFEGRIPDIILPDVHPPLAEDTLDTLFVNAWDPHSVVGNGNEHDNSIDGFFGRHSDMGYMSYPAINPYVLHNIVRI
jgi:hypothetical protein